MSFFQDKYTVRETILETPPLSYYVVEEKEGGGLYRCARIIMADNAESLEDLFNVFRSTTVAQATGFIECLECHSMGYAYFVFCMPTGPSLHSIVATNTLLMKPLPEPFIKQLMKTLINLSNEYTEKANNCCPLFFTPHNIFVDGDLESDSFSVHVVMDYLGLLSGLRCLDLVSLFQCCYIPINYLAKIEQLDNGSMPTDSIILSNSMLAWNIGAIVHYSIYNYQLVSLPFSSLRTADLDRRLGMFPNYYSASLKELLETLLAGTFPKTTGMLCDTQEERRYLNAIKTGDLLYVRSHKDEMRNVRDRNGYTGLMLAVTYGWIDLVKELVSTEAALVTSSGFSAMMLGCVYNQSEAVLLLRDSERRIALPNGKTAMMIAATQNHVDCIKVLATKEYELGVQDTSGQTALMYAILNHSKEASQYLAGLEYGYRDLTGMTALNYLVLFPTYPDLDTVASKLAAHNEELVANNEGDTPYLNAIANGNVYAVQFFRDLGISSDPNIGLQYALRCGQLDVANMLMPVPDEDIDDPAVINNGADHSIDTYLPLIYGIKSM
ncbi:Protein 21.1 [Giardia duodenalis ATCC 50581]|uniref:Protein 21.1 n=2 Tax=Giardia intestinalis TaxID=5741 RepID=C6LV30_GIAIB|nr:Protein 21.1 [Giardia intestinalis ATCC 50581]